MALIEGTGALTLFLPTLASAGTRYKLYPTSLAANTELTADTYLMQANCDCNSYKITFNTAAGNIVVKRSGDFYHTEQGAVDTTNSDSSHKVVWTVLSDDTIGTILPGSTGVPAVLGGSWGNAVNMTAAVTMNYWELRWVDNKAFLASDNASAKNIQHFVFKNCTYNTASVVVFNFSSSSGTSHVFKYIEYDNSNSVFGNGGAGPRLLSVYWHVDCSHVYVHDSNVSDYYIMLIRTAVNNSVIKYLNIKASGVGVAAHIESKTIGMTAFVKYCKCPISIYNQAANSKIFLRNCIFNNSKALWSFNNYLYISGCIFSGLTTCFIKHPLAGTWNISMLRNCVFINSTIVGTGKGTIFGVDHNGYYNCTETSWTRGVNDFTYDPALANFSSGTLSDDWLSVYGPGDGWMADQAGYGSKGDTNSYHGNDHTTQSHTGATETALTQAVGIAAEFSALS